MNVDPSGMGTAVPIPEGSTFTLFQFRYDTVDGCCGPTNIIGWFLDDITFLGPAPVSCSIFEEGECGNGEINLGEACDRRPLRD